MADYSYTISGSFNLPLGILFTFPSQYWFTIGLNEYLDLGAIDSHILPGIPT